MGNIKDGGANPPISTVRNIVHNYMKQSQGSFITGMLYFVLAQHTSGWVFWTLCALGAISMISGIVAETKEAFSEKN